MYLKDEDSIVHVLNSFEQYSELAGSKLNCSESKALSLGPLRKQNVYGIPVATHVEILGITDTLSGVSLKAWHQALKKMNENVDESLAYEI